MQQFGDTELGLGQLQLGWLLLALGVIAALALAVRSDAWLRTYKYTWAAAGIALLAADLRARQRRQRGEAHALGRPALRPAVGAAEGHPRRVPRRVPVREPVAARRREHAHRADPPAADPVPRADGRDVGDRPRHRRRPEGPRRGPPVLRRVPRAALRRDRPAVVRRRRPAAVHRRVVRPVQPLRPRAAARRQLARPVQGSARQRLPDRPGAVRLRARRPAGRRARRRPADDRRQPPDPGRPHRLPARGARRGARADRAAGDPRAVPGRRRARAADRRGGARRLPRAARRGPRAGRRGPGVHHRRRQPEADPAHRHHPAADLLRRVVAARERAGHRPPARPVRYRRRARRRPPEVAR